MNVDYLNVLMDSIFSGPLLLSMEIRLVDVRTVMKDARIVLALLSINALNAIQDI